MAGSAIWPRLLGLLILLSSVPRAFSKTITINTTDGSWIPYNDPTTGALEWLENSRRPSLYTGNFGNCMSNGMVDVTMFDAAYYKDNHTVNIHWAGSSNFKNQSAAIYFAVYAYGKVYWDMVVNPCHSNIETLCPMNSSVPIETTFNIPIGAHDAQQIPDIATKIPDFEGQFVMRILANTSTGSYGGQLACFSAVLTNGNTFAQPAIVGSILGFFAFVAFVSSVAAAVYGDDVAVMRTHYAHAPSVFVVFAVFQHIYFTGALSMNWPSVLPAFWSNYAWSGGMIFSRSMQDSIRSFVGWKTGSTSEVGAAPSGTDQELGGYNPQAIFSTNLRRALHTLDGLAKRVYTAHQPHELGTYLSNSPITSGSMHSVKRGLSKRDDAFSWYGYPVPDGVPLPGNYSGFAGLLSVEEIPASNAFLTGLLWFIIILVAVVSSLAIFKGIIEVMVRTRRLRKARLGYFRQHWLRYCIMAALRTCYIGFFTLTFLAVFQFTYNAATGPTAIAAIIFIIFLAGLFAVAGYACFYRLRRGGWISEPDRIRFEQQRLLKVIPILVPVAAHDIQPDDNKKYVGSIPFWRLSHVKPEDEVSVHDDVDYIEAFGWLNARFRRTRWWYFAAWLVYEFVRACVLGGASGHALTQVFVLLVVETVACGCLFYFKPFEGQRLNALVVHCLSISKVLTVALSAAFDVSFDIARIPTTGIGIVIILIQGILTILLLISIVLGAISSWFSVTRFRSDEKFRPRGWLTMRNRYLAHIEQAALDIPPPPKPEPIPVAEPEVPKGPYFSVNAVKRAPNLEDEDEDFQSALYGEKETYYMANEQPLSDSDLTPSPEEQSDEMLSPDDRSRRRVSRTFSMYSATSHSSLPFGARAHRASWRSDLASQYSSMDPAEFMDPPVPVPALHKRHPDADIMDNLDEAPNRPRLTSRASVGSAAGSYHYSTYRYNSYRYSSYSQGFGDTPVANKRMSLGAMSSYENLQMERSHPDYVASLNQEFTGNGNGRPKSTSGAPLPASATLARALSAQSAQGALPTSIHSRSSSGESSATSQARPQSPSSPLMSSLVRGLSRRSSHRYSMPASPVSHLHEEGVD